MERELDEADRVGDIHQATLEDGANWKRKYEEAMGELIKLRVEREDMRELLAQPVSPTQALRFLDAALKQVRAKDSQ